MWTNSVPSSSSAFHHYAHPPLHASAPTRTSGAIYPASLHFSASHYYNAENDSGTPNPAANSHSETVSTGQFHSSAHHHRSQFPPSYFYPSAYSAPNSTDPAEEQQIQSHTQRQAQSLQQESWWSSSPAALPSNAAESARSASQISALFEHIQSSGHFDAQLHTLSHDIESSVTLLQHIRSFMLQRLDESATLKYLPQSQRAKEKSRLFQQFKSVMHQHLDGVLSAAITETIEKKTTEKAWVDVVRNAFEELAQKETEEDDKAQKRQMKLLSDSVLSRNNTESNIGPSNDSQAESNLSHDADSDSVEEILRFENNNAGGGELTPEYSEDDDVVEIDMRNENYGRNAIAQRNANADADYNEDDNDDDAVVEIAPKK